MADPQDVFRLALDGLRDSVTMQARARQGLQDQ